MVFKIYIREDIANEIRNHGVDLPKIIESPGLTITEGMLVKGNNRIPIEHILFIQEVI